jgi:2-desacetyl-2-hydroxyethyl bacteriochlorophyllide A dehydrogenase
MQAVYAVMPGEETLQIEHEEIDPSNLRPYEVLVEADTTVISAGTELAIYTGIAPGVHTPGSWNAYPWRPGYGLVGHARVVGGGIDALEVDDRIFCFGKHASRQIYDASARTPQNAVFALGDELLAETAVMLRMGLIALAGVQITTVEPGDTVCVFGLGLVGNLAAQLYQIAGAQVIALDPVEARCNLARRVGIEIALPIAPELQIEAIHDLTQGEGVAVAVDAVGHTAVIQHCIEACAPFGQVILLGSPRTRFETDATPSFRLIHNRWLTVRGALEWRIPPLPTLGAKHSVESNLRVLIDHVQRGRLQVDALVSHVIKPDGMSEAYHGLMHDKASYMGIVVEWRGTGE